MATPATDAVKRLVDRFDQDRKVFLSGDYKEEQLRAEFLNPLFTALGWDMDNICEPDNSEFRTQRPECRTAGHSDFWFLISDFCIIRSVNRKGLSETFKQVIHEESIQVAGAWLAVMHLHRPPLTLSQTVDLHSNVAILSHD